VDLKSIWVLYIPVVEIEQMIKLMAQDRLIDHYFITVSIPNNPYFITRGAAGGRGPAGY